MKVNLIKVNRYNYDDKNGVNHSGCAFDCLVPTLDEDAVGFDVRSFRCDYKYYEKIVGIYNENKPVDLNLEFIPMRNGNYYSKLKSINDIQL